MGVPEVPAMRLDLLLVLIILIGLFATTRYLRQHQTPHICVDNPAASVCER